MALKIVSLHHHAVRINDDNQPLDAVHDFYTNVLGLKADQGRPNIAGVPGWWMNVGEGQQIHLMGGSFPSAVAKGPGQDPCASHMALLVENIAEAKAELERQGIKYWSLSGVAGPEMEQVFVTDPCGNMIELQQAR